MRKVYGTHNGNDTPSALYADLDEESSSCKTAEAVWQDPEGDHGTGEQAAENNSEAPAEELRDVTRHKAAHNGTAVADDRRNRGVVRCEAFCICDRQAVSSIGHFRVLQAYSACMSGRDPAIRESWWISQQGHFGEERLKTLTKS